MLWQSTRSRAQWYSRVQIYFCNTWKKELLLESYDLSRVKRSKWRRFGTSSTSAWWTTIRKSVVWPRFGAKSASCSARIKALITDWATPATWRTWITSDRGWTTVHFLTWTTWTMACSMASICRSSRTWCSPPTCSEVKINVNVDKRHAIFRLWVVQINFSARFYLLTTNITIFCVIIYRICSKNATMKH